MEFITREVLGSTGVIMLVGALIFFLTYKNSVNLFQWVENQTFGTRDYIMEKLDLLFIEIEPSKITMGLLLISFGLGLLVMAIIGFFVSWVLGAILGFVVGFIGWKLPKPVIHHLIGKRIKEYNGQVVDALQLMSNGIRAGLSLPQCLGMVVDEMPAPVSQEFNLMLQQNKIGVPLEECFENFLKRMPTQDNEMFVTSVNVLRETGGNLAETFDTIVFVVRERIRVQQKIDTFIASNKAQGMIIFCMPFAMTAIFSSSDPEAMSKVFSHPVGWIMLGLALILDLIGGFVILKIINIKV